MTAWIPAVLPRLRGCPLHSGLDDWTQTKGRREASYARRPACSSILIISIVTIYFECTHPSTATLGKRPNHSADTDNLSGHLGSSDIKVAPEFCRERIGLFKDTTGGGGSASLPMLWVRLQPVSLHNSCLALGQNHNSGHMSDVKISYPGSLVAMATLKGRQGGWKETQPGIRHGGNLTEVIFWEDF